MALRVKLLLAVLAMVTLALVGIGVASTVALRHYLMSRVDRQVSDTATMTAQRTFASGQLDQGPSRGPALGNAFYVRYRPAGGSSEELQETRSGQSGPVLPAAGHTRVGRLFTVDAAGKGSRWRAMTVRAATGAEVTVAVSLNEVDGTVAQLALLESVIAGIILVALVLVAHLLIRSSLRGLVQVERTAEAIAAGDLSLRVPSGPPRTEVGRLATAFNTMLGRIEEAFAARQESEAQARESELRMRRFVGDASHELRTPLTAIRGFAELYRQNRRDADALLERIEGHATRMGCWSTTCCCWPGSTRSGRWTASRSTCWNWPPTRCSTRVSRRPTTRCGSRSSRATRRPSWWATTRGSGRCSPTCSPTRTRTRRRTPG